MTRGETNMNNLKENEKRDESEAVSPSRPLIGSTAAEGNAERQLYWDEDVERYVEYWDESKESFSEVLERCYTTKQYMEFVRGGILPDDD